MIEFLFVAIVFLGFAVAIYSKDELLPSLIVLFGAIAIAFLIANYSHWSILMLAAIPLGVIISRMASDEIKLGKRWFGVLAVVCFLAGFWFYLTGAYVIAKAAAFTLVLTCVSLASEKKKRKV